MPSLPKDRLEEFIEGLFPDTRLLIEPKIYGCTIAIKYMDGKFDSVITRERLDVSGNIEQVKEVPKEINIRSSFVVHGELFSKQEAQS